MLAKIRLLGLIGMIITVAVLLGLLSSNSAQADGSTYWTGVGSGFTMDETSRKKYNSHVHTLKYKGKKKNSIFGRINIAKFHDVSLPGDGTIMEVAYRDQDGPGTDYQVRVLLRKVRRTDDANFLVTDFDSNNFAASNNTQIRRVTVSDSLDDENFAYYVEVRMFRIDSANNPVLSTIRIFGAIF